MTVLAFQDARHLVEEHARRAHVAAKERVSLLEAPGRVLAQEIVCDRDLPPFPRATRDGYAVRAEDVAAVPASLRVTAEIHAGMDVSGIRLEAGECAEIMTGAAVPAGADAVVMVEYTESGGRAGVSVPHNQVEIRRGVVAGENLVQRGAEARAGQVLVQSGARLSPAAVAAAASVGCAEVDVFLMPRVAVLATGDELVSVSTRPLAHQIRNSNTYSLAAQVQRAGGVAVPLPVAPDEESALRSLIEQGLDCDLLLLSGGVSMGKYDLVEKVLANLGAEFLFTGVAIQPGKPTVFGSVQWKGQTKYFFGLPGNPVSTMVTFELFARALVEALSGARPSPLRYSTARVKSEIKTKTGLTRFLPALLTGEFANVEVELVRWQGSGDMVATARANCLAVIPPDRERFEAGEMVFVLSL